MIHMRVSYTLSWSEFKFHTQRKPYENQFIKFWWNRKLYNKKIFNNNNKTLGSSLRSAGIQKLPIKTPPHSLSATTERR